MGKDTDQAMHAGIYFGILDEINARIEYYDNKYHTSEYSKFVGRKKLLWDGDNMKITNFDEANQFVGRTRRPGWNL